MTTAFAILISTFFISLAALFSAYLLSAFPNLTKRSLLGLIALASGTMLSTAFLHLLPEANQELPGMISYYLVIASFLIFFFLEKVLHWRHCHKMECEHHSFGYLNLLGDGVHNFIDGLVIAAAFSVDLNLGITTTIAMALHEIPQEVGDFGVLLLAGFSKSKALVLNFAIALTVVAGGLVGYWFGHELHDFSLYLLPIAAGGFIYIAATDLLPQVRQEKDLKATAILSSLFLLGLLIIPLFGQLQPEHSHTVNHDDHQHEEAHLPDHATDH